MGTFTDLSVGGYSLWSTRSRVVPEIMTVFRECDRNEINGDVEYSDETEPESAVTYSCVTSTAIQRLDVMGFTLKRVREEFESSRASKLREIESDSLDCGSAEEFLLEEKETLELLSFDNYSNGLRAVVVRELTPWALEPQEETALAEAREDPILRHILREELEYPYYPLGFMGSDPRSLIRLACEFVAPESLVVQDVTGVIQAGYYGEDERICESAIQALTARHPENSPVIILTEGSTDWRALRDALGLLYPQLFEYYSFFDFDRSRSQGGAGHLVSIVKAFAASGITNRIVALFDNDTAATEARKSLVSVTLPDNIRVLNYPPIEALRSYPTLGPGGLSNRDVNGLAGSIELYLGSDVLTDGDTPTPVQWTGYNQGLDRYHGEVLDKKRIQTAFREKVKRSRTDPEAMRAADWAGLRSIWEDVIHAFDDENTRPHPPDISSEKA